MDNKGVMDNKNVMGNSLSIEEKLQQLVPSSVSEEGQVMLGDAVDQLASDTFGGLESSAFENPHDVIKKSTRVSTWKIAAAVALLAIPTVAIMLQTDAAKMPSSSVADTALLTDAEYYSELVVLTSTNRIDASEDDGLIIPDNGSAPHYRYRYHVTDEEQVRDEETGTVITLRQSRQEVVTVPVTEF